MITETFGRKSITTLDRLNDPHLVIQSDAQDEHKYCSRCHTEFGGSMKDAFAIFVAHHCIR